MVRVKSKNPMLARPKVVKRRSVRKTDRYLKRWESEVLDHMVLPMVPGFPYKCQPMFCKKDIGSCQCIQTHGKPFVRVKNGEVEVEGDVLKYKDYNNWCIPSYMDRAENELDYEDPTPAILALEFHPTSLDKEKLERLFTEAVDVAFILCNKLNQFTPKKILSIINQLLPTAYVLDTCYWPFYQITGQSLCICRYYDISCPHALVCEQFIDIDLPLSSPGNVVFDATTPMCKTVPRHLSIELIYDSRKDLIRAAISFTVVRLSDTSIKSSGHVQMFTYYDIMKEVKRPLLTVNLEPHPRNLKYYGKYQRYDISEEPIPNGIKIPYDARPRFTVKPYVSWEESILFVDPYGSTIPKPMVQ